MQEKNESGEEGCRKYVIFGGYGFTHEVTGTV